jgi:hypothetical protein
MTDDEFDLDDLQDIAAGTPKEVTLPKGVMPSLNPRVVRWGHEEDSTEHRAIRLGDPSLCSCGWSGTNWTSHLLTGDGGIQAKE